MFTSITFDDISPKRMTSMDLKRLLKFLDEVNVPCTFFVVPSEMGHGSSELDEFNSCLMVALDKGHELALHGYLHIRNEFGYCHPIPLPIPLPKLKKQKERLEEGVAILTNLLGVRPVGFRAPFYLHNWLTLKALSGLGFSYDSSATVYKPAHGMRFKIKCLRDCKPFVKERIIELPVSGDYTLTLNSSNFSDYLKTAIRDFEQVKSKQGVFVMTGHVQRLRDIDYLFLRSFIKNVSKMTDFFTLRDVAARLSKKNNIPMKR